MSILPTAAWAVAAPLAGWLADEGPAPEDVKAGWLGFGVWLALAAAVVVLAFSLTRHLKRVDFEEEPDAPAPGSATARSEDDPAT